jgi:hypothetical protein
MILRLVTVVCLLALIGPTARAVENDDETRARKLALDVAGAFSNEGFKIRDGHWSGTVAPRERALIAVNLYAGNQYWFSAGAAEKADKIAVEVFDENGRQVVTDPYNDDRRAAAGFSPTTSGQYFVSVGVTEGEPTTCCLIYSYK